ncbi:MAG: cytochrome C oxidase subunit IV family protein [Pseudomonadota bacterium]
MNRLGHAEKIWLLLLALTLAGAWLAETGHAGWPLTFVVAGLIAFKGRLVIDHYMAITAAHPRIRRILHGFVTLVPLLVIFSHGWGDVLRRFTTLH